MSDICVMVENLSKRFFVLKSERTVLRVLRTLLRHEPFKRELWVLRNVSFKIKKGQKLAIIGKNGSGKTTLLRILTGIYDKTSGYVKVVGTPGALFKHKVGFNLDLSVADNIYLFGAMHNMRRGFLKKNMDKILETAELHHLKFCPLNELSMGQSQRLALSIFFQTTDALLIFDESLAFVDHGFVQKCESYFQGLSSSEKTVIMASHDTSFLRKYCKMALWLDGGRIRMLGDAGDVIDEYEESLRV